MLRRHEGVNVDRVAHDRTGHSLVQFRLHVRRELLFIGFPFGYVLILQASPQVLGEGEPLGVVADGSFGITLLSRILLAGRGDVLFHPTRDNGILAVPRDESSVFI